VGGSDTSAAYGYLVGVGTGAGDQRERHDAPAWAPPPLIAELFDAETDELASGAPPVSPAQSRRPHNGLLWLSACALLAFAVAVVVHARTSAQRNAVAPAPSATPSSSAPARPVQPSTSGFTVSSSTGRFQATFPFAPAQWTAPVSTGTIHGMLLVAQVNNPLTTVASAVSRVPAAAADFQSNLHGIIASYAAAQHLAASGELPSTFRSWPSRTAQFTVHQTQQWTVLAIYYAPDRVYLLSAETGAAMLNLRASFAAAP
jgi:hypothetical protein